MPELNRDSFDELKRQFATATDFAAFWAHFVDEFAATPGFMELGAAAQVEGVEILICRVASQMCGELVEPVNTRLIKISQAGLVHGSCMVNGQLCCVVLFEELEMGLFVMMGHTGRTHYARFTLGRGKNQA